MNLRAFKRFFGLATEKSLINLIHQDQCSAFMKERPLVDLRLLYSSDCSIDDSPPVKIPSSPLDEIERLKQKVSHLTNALMEKSPNWFECKKVPTELNAFSATPTDTMVVYTDGTLVSKAGEKSFGGYSLYWPQGEKW